MNASRGSLRTRPGHVAQGRVALGSVVVLASILVLPPALWLITLVIAMASRPLAEPIPSTLAQPALRQWIVVTTLFVGAVVMSMLLKPTTAHGIQLLVWFSLLPAIGGLFWFSRRRACTATTIWLGATVGACTAGVIAMIQVALLGNPRAEGVLGNAISFGNLALLMGAVSVSLHRVTDVPRRMAVSASLVAAASGLMASVLSGSRGGWIMVPVLIGVLLWQARSELTPMRVACVALGVVSVIGLADIASGGMPASRASAGVTNMSTYSRDEPESESAGSSEGARIEAWRSAESAFQDNPISGIGWGNLGDHFDQESALGLRNERIATFEHAHNQLIGAAANGGLIGLAAMVALFAVPSILFARAVRTSDRRQQTLGLTGLIVLGSFATFGLTEAVLENLAPVTFLAIIMAALCAELDAAAAEAATNPASANHRAVERLAPARRHPATSAAYWSFPQFGTRY